LYAEAETSPISPLPAQTFQKCFNYISMNMAQAFLKNIFRVIMWMLGGAPIIIFSFKIKILINFSKKPVYNEPHFGTARRVLLTGMFAFLKFKFLFHFLNFYRFS